MQNPHDTVAMDHADRAAEAAGRWVEFSEQARGDWMGRKPKADTASKWAAKAHKAAARMHREAARFLDGDTTSRAEDATNSAFEATEQAACAAHDSEHQKLAEVAMSVCAALATQAQEHSDAERLDYQRATHEQAAREHELAAAALLAKQY